MRDQLLQNVKYDLVLNLLPYKGTKKVKEGKKPANLFRGRAKIEFDLKEIKEEQKVLGDGLFLDFHGDNIKEMRINEHAVPLEDIVYNNHRIYISKSCGDKIWEKLRKE